MINLALPPGGLNVLCLGAHPDDIELGCGGTLLELSTRQATDFHGLVLTGRHERRLEARDSLSRFVPECVVEVLDFPDGRLPAVWSQVKTALEERASQLQPDLIFAPSGLDAHQDHRMLGELVTTVWRDSLVLRYEIPKWDGDLTKPTHYVPISPENARRKVELLNQSFPSQQYRDWWDDELFLALMRIRGMECRTRYAEAFTASKVQLRPASP